LACLGCHPLQLYIFDNRKQHERQRKSSPYCFQNSLAILPHSLHFSESSHILFYILYLGWLIIHSKWNRKNYVYFIFLQEKFVRSFKIKSAWFLSLNISI
jgi:hypothetical protein